MIFVLVTLTLKFDLLLKSFNLGLSFLTRRGRVFIFHIRIPYDKTFYSVPWFVTLTLKFDLLSKDFNLDHSFFTRRGRAFIFICAFLVARPFMLYHDFWPSDLDLEVWLKFTLSWAFEWEELFIVAIYICLPPANFVVFLRTLVCLQFHPNYTKSDTEILFVLFVNLMLQLTIFQTEITCN